MPWIDRCLASLKQSSIATEVFVVDNGSKDGTIGHINNHYSWVEIFDAKENLGFGKANNYALKIAWERGFEWFFLLNQDAWPTEIDTLNILMKAAFANPDFGVLSPIHLESNETKLDRHFSQYMKRSEPVFPGKWESARDFVKIYEVPFVNAAAWFVSRKCLTRVGLFHPLFDHYGEDINFLDRVRYYGFKVGVVGKSAIVHDRTYGNRKSALIDSQRKFKRRMLIFLLHPSRTKNKFRSYLKVLDLYTRCTSFNYLIPDLRLLIWCFREYRYLRNATENFDNKTLQVNSIEEK